MELLTWTGVALGIGALMLGVVALNRAAPTFYVGYPEEGRYEIWHSGPNEIVVRRAIVIELDTELEISEQSGVTIEDIDGAPFPLGNDPFGRGERMLPHRRYYAFINVNRSLVIKYRAVGFLGHLSRATLRIDEGP